MMEWENTTAKEKKKKQGPHIGHMFYRTHVLLNNKPTIGESHRAVMKFMLGMQSRRINGTHDAGDG